MVVYAVNVILYQEILERSSEFERSMEISSRSDSVASKASVRSIEEHNLEESIEGDNRRLSTSELAIIDSNTSNQVDSESERQLDQNSGETVEIVDEPYLEMPPPSVICLENQPTNENTSSAARQSINEGYLKKFSQNLKGLKMVHFLVVSKVLDSIFKVSFQVAFFKI